MAKGKRPMYAYISGERHKLVVFRVETFDEHGKPETLTHLPESRTAELSTGPTQNHFILAYVKCGLLAEGD